MILKNSALMSKKPAVVIAIARSVNGSIFARSLDRSSLTYDVIRTAATRAADISRIVDASSPFDRTKIRIARTANQKNVRTGRITRYSMM